MTKLDAAQVIRLDETLPPWREDLDDDPRWMRKVQAVGLEPAKGRVTLPKDVVGHSILVRVPPSSIVCTRQDKIRIDALAFYLRRGLGLPDPHARTSFDPEGWHGNHLPLLMHANQQGCTQFRVLDGNHRVVAAKLLGVRWIDALFIDVRPEPEEQDEETSMTQQTKARQALPDPPVPARRPCPSCPYRCDVPSGVWDASEYAKLAAYDGETYEQPTKLFYCHQRDQRLCAGWVAVHDMDENLAVRIAASTGVLDEDALRAVRAYSTDVELHDSGTVAADHGTALLEDPDPEARELIRKLIRTGKAGSQP